LVQQVIRALFIVISEKWRKEKCHQWWYLCPCTPSHRWNLLWGSHRRGLGHLGHPWSGTRDVTSFRLDAGSRGDPWGPGCLGGGRRRAVGREFMLPVEIRETPNSESWPHLSFRLHSCFDIAAGKCAGHQVSYTFEAQDSHLKACHFLSEL
jgi:hypothetical protein